MQQAVTAQRTANGKTRLEKAIDELFVPSNPVSGEVAREYLKQLLSSQVNAEGALQKGYAQIVSLTIIFLLFDSGIAKNVTIQGVNIERAGRFLILFPVVIAFLDYLSHCRVIFISELRLAIALMYKRLHESIYVNCLDVLVLSPSFRNVEMYESVRVGSHRRGLIGATTTRRR